MKRVILFAVLITLSAIHFTNASAQNFQIKRISDKIVVVVDPEGGEDQLVVKSEKGLVVFNTFWSAITAQKYKKEITKALNRDDFAYTINMVDRLDMFGGNAAYQSTTIIGHANLVQKFQGKDDEVKAEINQLIEMWRWKEDVSRKRLKTHEPGSEQEKNEISWMNTCKQRADDLEAGFSLVLPTVVYEDRKTVDLGDLTLELIWFGKAGYNGMTVAKIPEERIAIIPGFLLHAHHLAPHPHNTYTELDVPRWIRIFEEFFEGENSVDRVICSGNQLWTKERAATHLHYIRKLWNDVRAADVKGKLLAQIHQQLSLDTEYSFVKQMPVYLDNGDEWVRPQHQGHINIFFLQGKNLATEFLKKEIEHTSMTEALKKLKQKLNEGTDFYFDEYLVNGFGYELLGTGKVSEAIEIFKFNVEQFPESSNVYDSLGEAFMKSGDTKMAIEYYKKSLELNPENENAREVLKKLKN